MNKTRLLFPLLLAVSISCASKESAENTATNSVEFSYEVDTVMVDVGDHFFFLNWSLSLSDVFKDQKYLYNLNPQTFLLEIVDLDDLRLERTVQLEKEGPYGIGSEYYQKIQVLENGNICLYGQFKIYIVSAEGKLVNSIEFDKIKLKDFGLHEDGEIRGDGILSDDGKLLVTPLADLDYQKPAKGFVLIDFEAESAKYVPLGLFAKLKQFEITHQVGNAPGISTGEVTYFNFIENKLIVSSSAYNEAYQYNMSNDSLSHYSFKSNLTNNEKILNYHTLVSSDKGWDDSEKAKSEQVSFNQFFKLSEANAFWRLRPRKRQDDRGFYGV